MGNVNFLPPTGKEEKKAKKDSGKIEWTKPQEKVDQVGKSDNTENFFSSLFTRKNPDKISDNDNNDNMENNKKLDLFKWLKKSAPVGSSEFSTASQIKKNKEFLVDYQELFNKEKEKRANGTVVAPAASSEPAASQLAAKDKFSLAGLVKNKWQAPKMLKTNLIAGELTIITVDWRANIKNLITGISLTCLLIAIAYCGLLIWETRIAEEDIKISGDIENLSKLIISMKDDLATIDVFQKKLALANSLLNNHIYWTNFFDWLEKNTLKEVYYTGDFAGNTDGVYTFAAKGSDYGSITKQLKVWQAQYGDKILSTSAYAGSFAEGKKTDNKDAKNGENADSGENADGVTFDIELKVDQKIFYK